MDRFQIEFDNKQQMLDTFQPLLNRKFDRVYISSVPPPDRKYFPRYTQPWFKIVMSAGDKYTPGYYNNGIKTVHLNRNDVLVVHPSGFLSPGMEADVMQSNTQLIFRDKYIRYISSHGTSNRWWHSVRPLNSAGKYLIQSLIAMPNDPKYTAVFTHLITALLKMVYTTLEEDQTKISGKAYFTYQRALEYTIANFYDDINRESVARATGVTPSHLSRLFLRFEGEDFKVVLKKTRLERAVSLLRDTTCTIEEIACLCGFKSSTHFIRVFRQFYNISPGRYRDCF